MSPCANTCVNNTFFNITDNIFCGLEAVNIIIAYYSEYFYAGKQKPMEY